MWGPCGPRGDAPRQCAGAADSNVGLQHFSITSIPINIIFINKNDPINVEESSLMPAQTAVYLGIHRDAISMRTSSARPLQLWYGRLRLAPVKHWWRMLTVMLVLQHHLHHH